MSWGNANEISNLEDHKAVIVDIPEAAGRQGVKKANVIMCLAENNHYLGIGLEVPVSEEMGVLSFQSMRAQYLKHRGFWW